MNAYWSALRDGMPLRLTSLQAVQSMVDEQQNLDMSDENRRQIWSATRQSADQAFRDLRFGTGGLAATSFRARFFLF